MHHWLSQGQFYSPSLAASAKTFGPRLSEPQRVRTSQSPNKAKQVLIRCGSESRAPSSAKIPALTDAEGHASLAPMMRTIAKSLLLLLLPVFLVSCATTSITNLTPSSYPRNPTGQYMVEMAVDTTQQTFIPSTVTPTVVVGFQSYPMRPTKKTQNRWEGLVPIPANKDAISYHFKVDYEYQKFGKTGKGSLLSPEYGLTVK
jgi:hypothetical protein